MQIPLVAKASSWSPTTPDKLPGWDGIARVGVDCETRDPDLKKLGPGVRRGGNNYVVGVSFAFEDGEGFYLPVAHAGGGNLVSAEVWDYLKKQAESFTGIIVGANLSYDLDWLAQYGVVFRKAEYFRDVQVAEPLINELELSYSLENIAKRHGMSGKDESQLLAAARAYGIHPKSDLWRLPAHLVAPYAIEDAALPLRLLRKQERIIDDEDLWDVYNLESNLLPILVKMRRRGVRIDTDKLTEIENWALAEETSELAKIEHLTGVHVPVGDVWKTDALVPALEAIGAELAYTADGNHSIDKEYLKGIDHQVARSIERARKTNKLRTTFAASVREHMVNGRIHCTFNQLRFEKDTGDLGGAAYGRMSCVQPNLQQQPSRDEFAKMWRSIFIPDEGKLWAALDYSQQEPRMVVHFSEKCGLTAAKEAGDKYRTDPSTDNHQMMADMAGIERKPAKEIFLGLCYGMGGGKLCRSLGLPTKNALFHDTVRGIVVEGDPRYEDLLEGGRQFEIAGDAGRRLLNTFDEKVPFIKQLAKQAQAVAASRGYLVTLSGRHCRFPQKRNGSYDWTHKGLNRLIQGSSADQTKMAMVALDKAGHYLQLQVHDEIDTSVDTPEEAYAMAEIMTNCVELSVPSKVDVEIGSSWGDSMS